MLFRISFYTINIILSSFLSYYHQLVLLSVKNNLKNIIIMWKSGIWNSLYLAKKPKLFTIKLVQIARLFKDTYCFKKLDENYS